MEEAPRGVRLAEEEAIYRSKSAEPSIQLDMISPAVEGYFRIPAIWVGEEPAPETAKALNPSIHHQIVLKRTLKAGIESGFRGMGCSYLTSGTIPLPLKSSSRALESPTLPAPTAAPF